MRNIRVRGSEERDPSMYNVEGEKFLQELGKGGGESHLPILYISRGIIPAGGA